VSADFVAMAASASRARCVFGECKRLACGVRLVAWHSRLAEGAKGIFPRALRAPAPSPISVWAKTEEPDKREEGDDIWVPPLSGCGEGRSWLGRPTREQA
jgi:hypothetical protein